MSDAVLLLAHGAPERLEDVAEYLENVRGGRPTAPAGQRCRAIDSFTTATGIGCGRSKPGGNGCCGYHRMRGSAKRASEGEKSRPATNGTPMVLK